MTTRRSIHDAQRPVAEAMLDAFDRLFDGDSSAHEVLRILESSSAAMQGSGMEREISRAITLLQAIRSDGCNAKTQSEAALAAVDPLRRLLAAPQEPGASLQSRIVRARAEHHCSPGANVDEIAKAEARIGFPFTNDLRELLRESNGIRFWANGGIPCRLLAANEIQPVHRILGGDEGPTGLVAIVQIEGDVVAMGLNPKSNCFSRIVYCSHETYPHELFLVCDSLQDMLALVLDCNGQDWVSPAARANDVDFAR
jgi:hypothetical protein